MNQHIILAVIGVIVWLLVNFSKSDLFYGIKGIVILVFIFFMYKSTSWGYSIIEPVKYLIIFFSPSILILFFKLISKIKEKIKLKGETKKLMKELEERYE